MTQIDEKALSIARDVYHNIDHEDPVPEVIIAYLEAAGDGWQGMESAPRQDHAPVLLAVEWKPNPVVGEAYFHEESETWWWANTGPYEQTGEYILEHFILGWRPLPAPPAQEQT